MSSDEMKDPLKESDWKSLTGDANKQLKDEQSIAKKRLPKKIRQIPDSYFLPRRSLPSAIAFYGSFIVAGIGAGMLAEVWINKKIKGLSQEQLHIMSFFKNIEEDGGVIWEFDK